MCTSDKTLILWGGVGLIAYGLAMLTIATLL